MSKYINTLFRLDKCFSIKSRTKWQKIFSVLWISNINSIKGIWKMHPCARCPWYFFSFLKEGFTLPVSIHLLWKMCFPFTQTLKMKFSSTADKAHIPNTALFFTCALRQQNVLPWCKILKLNNRFENIRFIRQQLHLTQTLNTDALQRPNPGWWTHLHNKIHKQSIFLCAHMQHRQGLKLIGVSGFITYALPYQMSFVLPSLHLSPQMSSHVMKHMGLSWHCLQTGRAFGKRRGT